MDLLSLPAYAAVRAAMATLALAPMPLAEKLARAYLAPIDLMVPRFRRTAMENLNRALPDHDAIAVTHGVFRSLARLLAVLARFPRLNAGNVGKVIRYEGFEHFEKALLRGKGVLFATAHIGNWELSAFAHALMTAPMQIVVRPLGNPWLDRYLSRLRTLSGNRVIGKQDFARSILKALAANEAVGILVDQNTSIEEGVFVDFFGTPACAHAGLARIAARSGAAVIPGFAVWEESERRYVLRFYPEVEITGDAAADTQRVQSAIESVIRQYPDQWLWIHRRWKTQPPS
ncbi:MAG: lysophospholipid acyltransferase family protein [Bryobacteraceae bacterium]